MKPGKHSTLLLSVGLVILLAAGLFLGARLEESSRDERQPEQPIRLRLEQSGVRFLTEGGWVVDAFSPHSYIPESCLPDLAQLTHLKRLDLTGSRLSDASIDILCKMKQLKRLTLEFTLVTDAQLEKLGIELPNCQIVHEEEVVNPSTTTPDTPSESN